MTPQHHPLPTTVAKILPGQRPPGVPRTIIHHQLGVEPHHPAVFPQPTVQFIVLGAIQGGIIPPRRVQSLAPKHPQIHRVVRPLRPPNPKPRPPRAKQSVQRARHRALEKRRPKWPLPAPHIRRPGLLQSLNRQPQIIRRQYRVRIATRHHLPRRHLQRRVHPRRDDPTRIRHHPHPRIALSQQLHHGRRVRTIRHDNLHPSGIVLRPHRLQRLRNRPLRVARRHDHRHARRRSIERYGGPGTLPPKSLLIRDGGGFSALCKGWLGPGRRRGAAGCPEQRQEEAQTPA